MSFSKTLLQRVRSRKVEHKLLVAYYIPLHFDCVFTRRFWPTWKLVQEGIL